MFAYPTFSNNNYPLANTKPQGPQTPPATTSTMYVLGCKPYLMQHDQERGTHHAYMCVLDTMMEPLYQANTRHIQWIPRFNTGKCIHMAPFMAWLLTSMCCENRQLRNLIHCPKTHNVLHPQPNALNMVSVYILKG